MRRSGAVLFAVGAVGTGAVLAVGMAGLPHFGGSRHPYAARAVAAALGQHTSNSVASLTFDQRGFDTLGEEMIMLAAAVSAVMLLRRMCDEDEDEAPHEHGTSEVFGALRLTGSAYLPITLLVGGYVVAHGHLTPGGGFQGGVVLATAFHVSYLAGDYQVLERLRPVPVLDAVEASAAAAFVVSGLAGLVVTGGFLSNWLPLGVFGDLGSAGTVVLLNVVVGIEVGSAMVLLLARFLDQALLVRSHGRSDGHSDA